MPLTIRILRYALPSDERQREILLGYVYRALDSKMEAISAAVEAEGEGAVDGGTVIIRCVRRCFSSCSFVNPVPQRRPPRFHTLAGPTCHLEDREPARSIRRRRPLLQNRRSHLSPHQRKVEKKIE